ncbi:MAG: hypothetical protein NC904_02325 [Candidatus Omnitrophica bacterium]|nr:hypothetical protein [Candidatus Omnitrophota bacterium]
MLTTSSLELLSIVLFKDNVEEVLSYLMKSGVFHPIDISEVEKELGKLSTLSTSNQNGELESLEIRLTDILRRTGIHLLPSKDIEGFNYSKVKEIISKVEGELEPIIKEKEKIQELLKVKENFFYQVKEYLPFPITKRVSYTFLEVYLGKINVENLSLLEKGLVDIPHIFYPIRKEKDEVVSLIIGLKQDKPLIGKVLKELAWQEMENLEQGTLLSKKVEGKLALEVKEYKLKLADIEENIKKLILSFMDDLSKAQFFLMFMRNLRELKRQSRATSNTVLICGWVPEEVKCKVIEEIKKISPASYIESKAPKELSISKEDIPVYLKNNWFLKPFELLVNSYGVPRYGTIDPTVFVAIGFLIMFGVMFGDLGHGLVLSLLSLFLIRNNKEKIKEAGILILYCGISSSLFGILFGSFFGYEFSSLWFKPINNLLEDFRLSIIFGIGVISTAIIINVINALRDNDYMKAFFDKAGLISGVVYWSVIGLVVKVFIRKGSLSSIHLLLILGGIILLLCKPIIEVIYRKKKEGLITNFIEGVVDILEITIGYLANTLSFIRISAFSLAHTGLFIAVFELSKIVSARGSDFWSWVIIVLGNIFIILLEGMVVTIQSLRLNYYEFFSRFFVSGKRIYKPMGI